MASLYERDKSRRAQVSSALNEAPNDEQPSIKVEWSIVTKVMLCRKKAVRTFKSNKASCSPPGGLATFLGIVRVVGPVLSFC